MPLHDRERFRGERVGVDRLRTAAHHLARRAAEQISCGAQCTPQITVGDHTDQAARLVDDRGHAEALRRDLEQHFSGRRRGRNARQRVLDVHHVRHAQELAAEGAGRMQRREVLGTKAAMLEQRDRKRIPEGEGCGGAR